MNKPKKQSVGNWKSMFHENTRRLEVFPDSPDLLVRRAMLLMLDINPAPRSSLKEVEDCLLKALALNPEHLEALEEAAHFYDAVATDRQKAVHYANRYLEISRKAINDMQEIVQDSE